MKDFGREWPSANEMYLKTEFQNEIEEIHIFQKNTALPKSQLSAF
jgi:hypothetical protein